MTRCYAVLRGSFVRLENLCTLPPANALEVSAAQHVNVDALESTARYFSVFRCGQRGVCLTYKNSRIETHVAGAASADGLRFGEPRLGEAGILMVVFTWSSSSKYVFSLALVWEVSSTDALF